jgi:hypothetical protein
MRTTLTLDDNLTASLKKKAAQKRIPFKTMVNLALHLGLLAMEKPEQDGKSYVTRTRSLKPKAGYDPDRLGQIADEIEDEERISKGSDPSGC